MNLCAVETLDLEHVQQIESLGHWVHLIPTILVMDAVIVGVGLCYSMSPEL